MNVVRSEGNEKEGREGETDQQYTDPEQQKVLRASFLYRILHVRPQNQPRRIQGIPKVPEDLTHAACLGEVPSFSEPWR